MSLIIDAIKKAQQLRLKEVKGTPFFKASRWKDEKRRRRATFWILTCTGSGTILLLLVLFWGNTFFPPLTFHQSKKVSLREKKEPPMHTVTNKDFRKPSKKDVLPNQDNKSLSSKEPSSDTKGGKPLTKEMTEEKRTVKNNPDKDVVTERFLRENKRTPRKPLKKPPPLKKERVFDTIGLEQKGGKQSTLALDVLTTFNLGVSFYNRGEITKAIQAYQKVVKLDPTYCEAHNNLGIIYQEIGDFEKAFDAYQKSIRFNPNYEKAYNNLGILLYLKGRYGEAMEVFQKALALNSNNLESYINLGILFKKQGQLDRAIESYQKALAINPLHGETHYNIALLYEQLEHFELAIRHYQKFIQLSSKTRPGLVLMVKRHLEYLKGKVSEKRS